METSTHKEFAIGLGFNAVRSLEAATAMKRLGLTFTSIHSMRKKAGHAFYVDGDFKELFDHDLSAVEYAELICRAHADGINVVLWCKEKQDVVNDTLAIVAGVLGDGVHVLHTHQAK